jgi:hypothetical protein
MNENAIGDSLKGSLFKVTSFEKLTVLNLYLFTTSALAVGR